MDTQNVPERTAEPIYFVGIGASAGGLEALETFFTHMPENSSMAFIVIQHLSPDYKSMMVELLSKRTNMPVHRAEEGMFVKPNCVYLIPPKKNISIFHGKLLLSDSDHSRGINLPIDVFFRSLAEDQAEKSIGVILSGTGSDGVRGIRAIKESGGMVMVQDEISAKFDGMPRAAISTGLADFIMPPDEMPDKLLAFARYPITAKVDHPQAILSDEDGLTRIFSLLRERTGVDFTFYKPNTVVRRIERRMTFNQAKDLRDYVRHMENHPGEIMALYRELLIGVTSFFRDREVFDEMDETLIPSMIKNSAKSDVRIWVPGCSTGEEAYSYAIMLREAMERMEYRVDVKIFATDIDRDAIQKASIGLYPESISADLSPRLLTKYFHHKDSFYQVDRSIREMVVFAQHNLIKDPPFTNIDLVSCRNLLIYLQPVLQQKVMELINFSLNPQGILVLGTSETTGEMVDLFEPVNQKFKIYQSRGKRRPASGEHDFAMNSNRRPWMNRARFINPAAGTRMQDEERILDRFLQSLSGDIVPLSIIVNEQLEVLHILGDAEGYLRLPSGKIQNDITKMAVKDLSIPLSTGLQKVFKTGDEIKYTNIRLSNQNQPKMIEMRIRSIPGKKGQELLAVVLIQESVVNTREQNSDHEKVYDLSHEAEQRINDLEQELQFVKENLQATIEELETSNEELQATNEELLASNEELQSTNEELQSVNEELHTVNAEYQSKIIELTELNNDLNNFITSTKVGTLFLDENLEIRRFTPEIKKIFKILENDIGRPLNHLTHNLKDLDLLELVQSTEKLGMVKELEVISHDNEWYLLRLIPYDIGSGSTSGVVLSFINITQLKKAQTALTESEIRLESLYRTVPFGIGLLLNHIFIELNDQMCAITGYHREELIGQEISNLYDSHELFKTVQKECEAALRERNSCSIETIWKQKDGSKIPVIVSTAWRNPESKSEGMIITVSDISVRYQALQHAKDTEDRYQQLFESMTEGVVYHNSTGEIITANPSAQRILGLTFDEITGRTSFDPRWQAIHEDGTPFPGDQHPAMLALKHGKPVQGVLMGIYHPQKNEARWLRINAVPIFQNNSTQPEMVYATFNDITEQYQSSRELSISQNRLEGASILSQAVLDSIDMEMAILDSECNIIFTNRSWQKRVESNAHALLQASKGDNYLKVCQTSAAQFSSETSKFCQSLQNVLSGKLDQFELLHPVSHNSHGELYRSRITKSNDQEKFFLIVTHEHTPINLRAEE